MPPLLALVSRAAPTGLKATLIGAAFLSLFVSNLIVGWIGTFYESLGPVKLWTMEGCIAFIGGILEFVFANPLNRILSA